MTDRIAEDQMKYNSSFMDAGEKLTKNLIADITNEEGNWRSDMAVDAILYALNAVIVNSKSQTETQEKFEKFMNWVVSRTNWTIQYTIDFTENRIKYGETNIEYKNKKWGLKGGKLEMPTSNTKQ